MYRTARGNLEKQLADTDALIYTILLQITCLQENAVISTYDNVVNELFKQNEWLDLYIPHIDVKEYVGIERDRGQAERTVIETANEEIAAELYPKVQNPQMQDVILYILNNPESDLKQKTIASKLYMNRSYIKYGVRNTDRYALCGLYHNCTLKTCRVVTEKYRK